MVNINLVNRGCTKTVHNNIIYEMFIISNNFEDISHRFNKLD